MRRAKRKTHKVRSGIEKEKEREREREER